MYSWRWRFEENCKGTQYQVCYTHITTLSIMSWWRLVKPDLFKVGLYCFIKTRITYRNTKVLISEDCCQDFPRSEWKIIISSNIYLKCPDFEGRGIFLHSAQSGARLLLGNMRPIIHHSLWDGSGMWGTLSFPFQSHWDFLFSDVW